MHTTRWRILVHAMQGPRELSEGGPSIVASRKHPSPKENDSACGNPGPAEYPDGRPSEKGERNRRTYVTPRSRTQASDPYINWEYHSTYALPSHIHHTLQVTVTLCACVCCCKSLNSAPHAATLVGKRGQRSTVRVRSIHTAQNQDAEIDKWLQQIHLHHVSGEVADEEERWRELFSRSERTGRCDDTATSSTASGERGFSTPWAVFEERVRTGPYGLSHFPFQPYSPVHILILDTGTIGTGEVDPALPMFIRNFSPPRIRSEWHLRLQREAEPEEPGLTEEEFRKAMKKMKRHVHRPHNQGRRSWRRGPFSSRRAGGGEAEDDHKEQSKDCAVCLETFGVNQEVMTLPCNHMFHQDCIVPWVRRRGQCPVCRLDLCDSPQQQRHQGTENSALAEQRGGVNGNGGDEVIWDDELVHLIRAMEEALNWINLTR